LAYRITNFCLDAGQDVGATLVRPVELVLFGGGPPLSRDADGSDGAGEDEASQVGVCRGVQNVTQAIDVGAKQRRGVPQPRPRIDDAVKDVVAAGHRGAHRRVVEDVAVVVLDVEVLDRFRRAGPADEHPHVVAAVDELPGDMGAKEPACTDHQLLHACHGQVNSV
jgi:hypothetical protein